MRAPVWGVYSDDYLVATCRAWSGIEAQAVFQAHNERNPQFAIHGVIRQLP